MTAEEIKGKYPSPPHNPVLISEVTRMSKGVYCVAGLNIASQAMVRPLLADGSNWSLGADRSVFAAGNLVDIRPTGVRSTALPHANEDTRLQGPPVVLERFAEDETHALLLGAARPSVVEAIGSQLIDNKYVVEGTLCHSLGGVTARRKQVRFREDSYAHLRLSLSDSDGTLYDLKVTSDQLQHMFSPADHEAEPHFGVDEANEWLDANGTDDTLILRVGLTRPWDGKENQWNPKRCYLQLNGVICPEDNYHIFAGPPGA